jgi:hypothetical protein
VIKLHVYLNIVALKKEIPEEPVARIFIEALEEVCADGHDALKVFDFE